MHYINKSVNTIIMVLKRRINFKFLKFLFGSTFAVYVSVNSKCPWYRYNPKYYESGTFDIHILHIGSKLFARVKTSKRSF